MSVKWTIDDARRLVVVSGRGLLDRRFIKAYRAGMIEARAKNYRKLFDFTHVAFQVEPSDLDDVASSLTYFGEDAMAGPVAILVGTHPLTIDMAVLLKSRVGAARPLRIFRSEGEARQWLMFEPRLGQMGHASTGG